MSKDQSSSSELSKKKIKEAREYLMLWKTAKEAWKFNKNTQTYILKHLWNKKAVDKKSFKILLKYLQKIQGTARERLLAEANGIIKDYKKDEASTSSSSAKRKYKRAKKLVKKI